MNAKKRNILRAYLVLLRTVRGGKHKVSDRAFLGVHKRGDTTAEIYAKEIRG